MKNSLNNKNLEWINCPKCGWHNAVLNKQTGLITCQYCMYRSDKKRKQAKMTTELEQEFFKTFGIEPKMLCDCEFKNLYDYRIEYGQDVCIHTEDNIKEPCNTCELAKQIHPFYPEITDRILLELICILNKHYCEYYQCATLLVGNNVEEVKKCILTECLENAKHIKSNIQQLFKEEE